MTEEVKENKIEIENPKADKEKMVKWVVAIIFLFSIATLIIIKLQKPDFKLTYVLLIGAFILVISLILFFGFDIFKKYKDATTKKLDEEKLPPAASEEQLKKRIESILLSAEYQNHIKQYKSIKLYTVNKNLIYDFEIEPLYSDVKQSDIIHIVINAHYLDRLPTIMYNPSSYEVARVINATSSNPLPEANIEKTEVYNPITQNVIKTQKKTFQKKDDKKEKTQEDLG